MGGAPITFTLYANGILVTHRDPEFVTDATVEAQMRADFDAGREAIPTDPAMTDEIAVAIDYYWAIDKRNETYEGTPVPLHSKKKAKRRR